MTALAPTFKIMDQIAGLNLNHRKCCWIHYGSESCKSLSDWVATNCEEFREMKVVKYFKNVGTVIGPGTCSPLDGNLENFIQRIQKINAPPKAWLRNCATLRSMPFSVLSILGSISSPDEATLKAEAHALQCTTEGPYNATPTNLLCVGSV